MKLPALVALLLAGTACITLPDPYDRAQYLLAKTQSENYRLDYERAPGWLDPHAEGTTVHHGMYLDIYMNQILTDHIAAGDGSPWPAGSLLVKDGWNDQAGTMLHQISILQKESDGGWFGAEYTATGEAIEAGKNFFECEECHRAGDDYLLAF